MNYAKLPELIATVREHVGEIETVYTSLTKEGAQPPPIGQLALPFAYRCFARAGAADERVLAFMGQYLSTQYPGLTTYFTTEKQQEHLKSVRSTLDEFFAEFTATKQQKTNTTHRAQQHEHAQSRNGESP